MLDLKSLIRERKLIMVGGKGGVGKTTTSAALAVAAANSGRRTLIISTDPAHSLADAFDMRIGNKERVLAQNLSALELDPDEEVNAYLDRVLHQMRRYAGPDQVNELQRQLRLSSQSPGAQEAALIERISRIIDHSETDGLLIFDTAPTGHTLRLLTLPEVMAAWTEGLLKHNHRSEKLSEVLSHLTPGRSVSNPLGDPKDDAVEGMDDRNRELTETLLNRQRLFQRTRRLLSDTQHTGFLFVLTPEKLPILETARAVDSLQSAGIPVAGAVINRVMPAAEDNSFWAARRQRQQRHLEEIAQSLNGLARLQVPLFEDDIQGMEALNRLANYLV